MEYMSKEEVAEFRRKNNRVDAGLTKRTCATCASRKECQVSTCFLEKAKLRECHMWSPCFKTCGNCKHSVTTTIWFKFGCDLDENPTDKDIEFDSYRCDEGGWELASDFVRYPDLEV